MGMYYVIVCTLMCTVKAILVTFTVLQGIAYYIRGPPVNTSIKSIATYLPGII